MRIYSRRLNGFWLAALTFIFTSQAGYANIVGSDLQSFNPTSDGLDFVTVQSVRVLSPGIYVIGGFVDYAYNTLPPALNSNLTKFSVTDRVLSSDLHIAVGLFHDFDLGMSLSSMLSGTIDNNLLQSYFLSTGVTDFRANAKYHLLGKGNEGLSINVTGEIPWIVNDPFYGGGGAPAYDVELLGQTVFGRFQWGINGGYRFRNIGSQVPNAPYQPTGNEYIASTALAYHFRNSNWTAIGEIFGEQPVSSTANYSTSDLTGLEALAGVKYWGFKSIAVHAGLTTELLHGTSSPDIRVYAGLNWYPPRLWGAPKPAPKAAPPPPVPTPAHSDEDLLASAQPSPTPAEQTISASATDKDAQIFDKEPEAPVERFVIRDINFELDSDVVPSSFLPILQKLCDYLTKGRPAEKLTITGHTDSTGTAPHNQDLSQRRADSVKMALLKLCTFPADKIETGGMGQTMPIATNATSDGRSLNRRVEFKIDR